MIYTSKDVYELGADRANPILRYGGAANAVKPRMPSTKASIRSMSYTLPTCSIERTEAGLLLEEHTRKASKMNIAQFWDICLRFEYDRGELVTSLSEWIAQTGKHIVLDVACGTGFPSIDLLKLGFQITCCDGSPLMLQEFRRNAAIARVAVEPHCILWKDLPRLFASSSDIIMCRGNSLAYAGTWDEAHMASRRTITEALHNFYCCLKPGGIVYVDTASEKYLNAPAPESRTYTEQSTNGHIICLSETVYTDPVLQTRTWISKLTFGPSTVEFKRHCYLLQHSELCKMLREAGFRNITRCNIAAEHYAVFLGYKE